jgi:predicted GIY-YIG superfamily endonuclease
MIDVHAHDGLIVYLLHFDQELGGRCHYVGSTMYNRRFQRWREHAQGNGSGYTARYARAGIGFRVARLFFVATREHERVIKDKGDFKKICPICTPSLPQPAVMHYDADAWLPTIQYHWSIRKGAPGTG